MLCKPEKYFEATAHEISHFFLYNYGLLLLKVLYGDVSIKKNMTSFKYYQENKQTRRQHRNVVCVCVCF